MLFSYTKYGELNNAVFLELRRRINLFSYFAYLPSLHEPNDKVAQRRERPQRKKYDIIYRLLLKWIIPGCCGFQICNNPVSDFKFLFKSNWLNFSLFENITHNCLVKWDGWGIFTELGRKNGIRWVKIMVQF